MKTKRDNTIEVSPFGEETLPHVFIDDLLVALKYYVDEHESHLHIISQEVCVQCNEKACLYFCPAGVYQADTSGHVQIAYQSCIECGSCRIMCTRRNIGWKYPRGGFGIAYKFG